MQTKEKTKVVLISGVTSGIGKETLKELLSQGFLVCGFAPDIKKCKALETELLKDFKKEQFLILPGDVTKEEQLKKVIIQTLKKFKKIDVLINNAGLWIQGKLEDNDSKKIRDVLEVNTLGTILLTKLVLPYMKKQKQGLVINIISQAGIYAKAERAVYQASKWAITGFTKGMQEELAGSGVKVMGIYPGMIKTLLFKTAGNNRDLSNSLDVKDVVNLIVFAISNKAFYPELGIRYQP